MANQSMTDQQRAQLMMRLGLGMMMAGGPSNEDRMTRLGRVGLGTMDYYSQMMNDAMKRKAEEKRMDLMEQQIKTAQRKLNLEEKANKLAEQYGRRMAEYNTTPGDMFMPGAPPGGATSEAERQRGMGQLMTEYGVRMGSPGMSGLGMRAMYPEMYGQFPLPTGGAPTEIAPTTEEGPGIIDRISQMFAPSTPEPYEARTTLPGRLMMPEPKMGSMRPQNIAPSTPTPSVIGELPSDWGTKTEAHRKVWAKAYAPFVSPEMQKRLKDEGYL